MNRIRIAIIIMAGLMGALRPASMLAEELPGSSSLESETATPLAQDAGIPEAADPAEERVAESRPVRSIYGVEIGTASDLSTYLSPLYYRGLDMALSCSWTKAFQRWSDRCTMRFEAAVDMQRLFNPAQTALMYGMTGRFNWGLLWSGSIIRGLEFTLGPMIDIYGGAMYLPRNGNNPVNALGSAGLDIAGSISYSFRIGRLPVTVADEVRIPSLSGFFTPGYGETYYEIYLGNHQDLLHLGWWGNAMGIDNLVSVRLDLGRTGMMVGYRFDLRTFRANHLETQLLRNAFVISVIP